MVAFLDRLVNLVSGLGTTKDKSVSTAFALTLISPAELEAAYRTDWIAHKIVKVPAWDMTREWRNWQADEQAIEALEDAERVLRVRDKVACALERARLYGGAGIYVGLAGSERPELPLNVGAVRKGQIEYLHVLSRWELTAGEIDRDPLSPFYGEPRWYEIAGAHQTGVRIHPSRIVRFVGNALPNALAISDGWGDSVLQVVYDAVQNASSAQQHVASLIPEAKVDVISVPGLSDHLSTPEGTARVISRFSTAALIKSMHGLTLLEGGPESESEVWNQKQIQFGQFPALMQQFLQVAAGAADIPVTRLLGQSPAGLNATGDADIRNYYDGIAARQNNELRPTIDRLDEILIRHALGERPREVYYEWAPLWQLSEKERADIGLIRAQTDHIYATDATVPGPVLEQAIRNRLIESGEYPGIEGAYQDFDEGLLEKEPEDAGGPGEPGIVGEADPGSLPQRRLALMGDTFEEEKHPRDPEGKFAAKGAAGAGAAGGERLSVVGGKPAGGIPLRYDAESKLWSGEGVSAARLKALAIPPGWQNVRLSHDEVADLQVLAQDSKGRPQYRYSEAFAASKKAEKFERVGQLAAKMGDIHRATEADVAKGSDTAAAVRLMAVTGMRPGGDEDTQAKVKAYGATTLLKSHVRVEGDTVHYAFTGKKGVHIENKVKDKALAAHIAARLKQDDGDRLFQTDAGKANAYVKKASGGDFKSKDLRTAKANEIAHRLVASMPVPTTAKERAAAMNQVGDVVSSQLGNTRSVALADYINPAVFSRWGSTDGK